MCIDFPGCLWKSIQKRVNLYLIPSETQLKQKQLVVLLYLKTQRLLPVGKKYLNLVVEFTVRPNCICATQNEVAEMEHKCIIFGFSLNQKANVWGRTSFLKPLHGNVSKCDISEWLLTPKWTHIWVKLRNAESQLQMFLFDSCYFASSPCQFLHNAQLKSDILYDWNNSSTHIHTRMHSNSSPWFYFYRR